MDAQEIQDELAQPGAQQLLTTATLARLAYDGADGAPRVVPIGFHWTGSAVVMCTSTTAPKGRAIRERPRIAVTIDVGDTPAAARSLLIRGVATVEVVDGVPEEYVAGAAKSMTPEEVAGFRTAVEAMYPQMVRIALEPAWARFYDFGAGRLPATLQRLAEQATVRGGAG
jgi:nitroimidazol reductase NimA-like FMN-containing flavoprotein (pyridoxamine 5'-phosphate oxidase superfamily)